MSYDESFASSSSAAASGGIRWRNETDDQFDPDKVAKLNQATDYDINTYKQTLKKGDKDTFFCRVCRVELNSRETRQSHVQGAKHQRKLDQECRTQEERDLAVQRIPNPVDMRKKIPEKLENLLKACREPVVGLKYVKEFTTETDDEMEPHYECDLCENQGEANAMFNHLLGRDHRERFFKALDPRDEDRDFRTYELLRMAGRAAENTANASALIKKVQSDRLYPWPAGKAPWSIERGGDGQAPPGARARQSVLEAGIDRKVPLIHIDDCGEITPETLERFLDYGDRLAELLADYMGPDNAHAKNLVEHYKEMRINLEDLNDMRVKKEVKEEMQTR